MSLWSRLFGRKPQRLNKNDGVTWSVGDLAVCVADNWIFNSGNDPKVSDVLRVVAVQHAVVDMRPRGLAVMVAATWLQFRGHMIWYTSTGFRKAEEDRAPAEAEFTALLRRPVRPKVTAGEEWR